MRSSPKKFYVTTPIFYVNASPHIGHAETSVQADVLARHRRFRGNDVFYLTGTDEHGAKNVRAAEAAGKTPEEFTEEISEKFRALKTALNLSWDDFIRTSDRKRHWPGAILMWRKLAAAGDIYKKKYKGLYCVGHEAFVTQKDLSEGKCADHGKEPETIEEENYFFRLSKYGEKIGSKIRSGELKILPRGRENEILALIEREGLEDVSFSRPRKDLKWGIPVPGDNSQTIYVWCDALTSYLSAVGFGSDRREDAAKFQKFWPADVHLIGKDILRFHAAIWPGMLLSAGLPLPKSIFAHGFITAEGRKMSKTIGNIIDPFGLAEKYGADAVRYYLLREIPAGEDGDWSERKFRERYNGDLANGLGNFAARVFKVAEDEDIVDAKGRKPSAEVSGKIESARAEIDGKIDKFELHEALASIWKLISFGDEYANRTAPWRAGGEEKRRAIFDLLVILDNVAAFLAPFLPETAKKITENIFWKDDVLCGRKVENLFPRLN